MPLTKFTGAIDTIQSLPNKPNQDGGFTPAQLKLKFDQYAIDNEAYMNDILIPELDISLSGKANVEYVDEIASDFTLGIVFNNSLTETKMANDMKKDIVGGVASYDGVVASLAEKANHTKLLSVAYQKLNKKIDMTIVAQGDSLTYGQDTLSVDKRPAPLTTTDDGIAHATASEIAGKTYPEALQTYLRDIYNNNSIVINKGYSGDYAEESYQHWGTNSNADLALLMLGTNDSNLGATWVPGEVRGNIDAFLTSMRKIIKRYISWGTAVILLTPPKFNYNEDPTTTTLHNTEPFRHSIMLLGDEFGCPVIDAETFLNGCDTTYYSDSVHLNSKGYQYFSSRIASILIGYGVKSPVKIKSGDNLSVRPTRDNIVANGVSLSFASNSGGTEESTDGYGLVANITPGSEISFGFETLEDNLIFIPIHTLSGGATIKFELDFANEQGSIPILAGANRTQPQGFKPSSSVTSITETHTAQSYDGTIDINTTDRYIWITNKGWHNLKVTNPSCVGSAYFNGFVIMSYKDFITQDLINNIINIPTSPIMQKLIYPNYSATPAVVNSIDITASELTSLFVGNKLLSNQHWRGIPIKVTLYNNEKNIIEYGFMWHDSGVGAAPTAGFYQWSIKQTDLIVSPTDFRTITSITYDSVNRKYIVNFGDNTDLLGHIVISML